MQKINVLNSHWYSLLVNKCQSCNLFRNVEDATICVCVLLELYKGFFY